MVLSQEILRAIACQRRVHEEIREQIHREIPAQQLSILYYVAENEGAPQGEIAKALHMPQATVSRNVAKLAIKMEENRQNQLVDTGYGLLVNRTDTIDPRRLCVFLTPKGQEVLKAIAKAVLANCNRLLDQP
jgi:DNA-binding MarR family transcriptional regulator